VPPCEPGDEKLSVSLNENAICMENKNETFDSEWKKLLHDCVIKIVTFGLGWAIRDSRAL
jgi:hypothetical protein